MLEESTKAKSRNIRRGEREGFIFRIILGLLVVVLLAGVVMLASGLQETRLELSKLQERMNEPQAAPTAAPSESDAPAVDLVEFVELKDSVESIRSEVTNSLAQTTKDIVATGRDAASDRKTLKMNLARILAQQGAATDDIFPLTVGLSPEERSTLLDQIEEIRGEVAGGEQARVPLAGLPTPEDGSEPGAVVALTTKEKPPVEITPPLPTREDTGKEESDPEPAEESQKIYTVKKGDTIWDISQKFGVSYAKMLKVNKIRDARKVGIGTKLVIPEE